MKNKKILITGATGFVGSYLTRYLVQNGYTHVIAMKRASSRMDLVEEIIDKVTWVEGDILDLPFLEDVFSESVDVVFHSAAVVSFDPRDRENMYSINASGTANIVNAALNFDVEKLIHISSIAAIGRDQRHPIVSEDNKWQRSPLNSHYAISKYQAEQEVWRGIAEGLNAAIVNPTIILGAQFWDQGSGKLFEQVWDGLRFYTEGVTGYVDVRDVVRFSVQLMTNDINNQRFILNGENLPYKDMFEQIASVLQKQPATVRVTPFIRQLAWRYEAVKSLITGNRPLITRETAKASGTKFYFNNEKSMKIFPDFAYIPISKTIEETGKAFLESQKKGKKAAYLNF